MIRWFNWSAVSPYYGMHITPVVGFCNTIVAVKVCSVYHIDSLLSGEVFFAIFLLYFAHILRVVHQTSI